MTETVEPTPIGPAPEVPNSGSQEVTFDAMFEAFNSWQKNTLVPGINELASDTYLNAVAAGESKQSAASSANTATQQADYAMGFRDEARYAVESLNLLRQHFQGVGSVDPSMRVDGSALGMGDWYISATSGYIRTYNGSVWVQGISSISGVSSVNGQQDAVDVPKVLTYEQRVLLRANESWRHALIDGLGWFLWTEGSDEPDDDESCFATENGRWLLQAPHWDVIEAWRLPDAEWSQQRLSASASILRSAAMCPISSMAGQSQVSFEVAVPGANVEDGVFVAPDYALDVRITFFARVISPDVVTIYLRSPANGSTVATNGLWLVTVIKGA